MSSGEDLDDSELKIDEGSKIEEPEEAPPAGMMFIFRAQTAPGRFDRPADPEKIPISRKNFFGRDFFSNFDLFSSC